MNNGITLEIESIIDSKTEKNKKMFRVRWRGFSPENDTWEYEENIKDKNIIKKYIENKEVLDEKAKKNQNISPLSKLRQKKPIQVVSVMKFDDKIYYRVLFEDQTFDSVSSELLKKVAPEIIAKFLVAQFQLIQTKKTL